MSALAAELRATERTVLAAVPTRLLIGGQWREAAGGGRFAVDDPATGEPIAQVSDATPDDALAALTAAAQAQEAWAESAPQERAEILRRAFALMVQQSEQLALLLTLEMGKPLSDARAEIAYAAEFFRWFAGEAVRIQGRTMRSPSGNGLMLTMRRPVGPCVLVTPWNFPSAMGARKIAPAIAAGCTMVVKPAKQTPLSMLALAAIVEQAGLPPGVLNVIASSNSAAVVAPLLRDERTRKLSFTGSTEVGRQLLAQSADQVLRVSMELGGNAPFIVFEDADLDAAVEGAMLAKMRNMGEACTAANRFHVHERVAEEFGRRLARRMQALKVGRGVDPSVQVGPLIDARQQQGVGSLVEDAIGQGAETLTGGSPLDGPGHFFAPTVLAQVPSQARLLREEIFGPVAPIVSFADEQQAVDDANRTEYGLAAYLYTREIGRALRVAERLDVGMLAINQGIVSNPAAPFGGVKQSGIGREGGSEGIEEYLETKYMALAGACSERHR